MTGRIDKSWVARFLGADDGSVMMEYVVLLVFIVVGMAGLYEGLGEISNQGIYDYSKSSFGSLGSQIVHFYQQLQGGLSLPVP